MGFVATIQTFFIFELKLRNVDAEIWFRHLRYCDSMDCYVVSRTSNCTAVLRENSDPHYWLVRREIGVVSLKLDFLM